MTRRAGIVLWLGLSLLHDNSMFMGPILDDRGRDEIRP